MIPVLPREFLLAQIEAGVRFAPREAIESWLRGTLSIVDILFEPNKEVLRMNKDQALAVLDSISGGDLRDACLQGASDLAHLWYSPFAAARFEGEVAIMRRFVRDL